MFRLLRIGRRIGRINRYLASVFIIAFAVILASPLPEKTASATASIILLMAVLSVASLWGLEAGIASSVAGSLAYDFFFLPPFYSFDIDDWQNVLALLIFGFACGVVCLLAQRLRERARAARHREVLAKRLQAMIQRFFAATDMAAIAQSAVTSIGVALGAKAFLVLRTDNELEIVASHPKNARLSESEFAAANLLENYRRIGDPFGNKGLTCSLLPVAGRSSTVLIVGETTRRFRRLPDRLRMMDLFAGQAAAAFERVTLATQIQMATIAAETEKLRSAVLTGISHDLKAPLSIILGSASGLITLKSSLSSDTTQDLLNSILEEGQRLDQFIANLLDMSRVESEEIRPKRQLVELEDVVCSALRRAERLLPRHRIVLRIPDDLPMLEIDPVLMEKVLFNVLENAAKYTPEGSIVTLSAVEQGHMIAVCISDEGPGIPEGQIAQLFQKFHRVETDNWKPAGTGLGLAICRGFLQAMGGSISASNRCDRQGAVFTIKLPATLQKTPQVAFAKLTEFQTPLASTHN
jgi:two-component system, OmpR family, sensor histidine kinase KdpD